MMTGNVKTRSWPEYFTSTPPTPHLPSLESLNFLNDCCTASLSYCEVDYCEPPLPLQHLPQLPSLFSALTLLCQTSFLVKDPCGNCTTAPARLLKRCRPTSGGTLIYFFYDIFRHCSFQGDWKTPLRGPGIRKLWLFFFFALYWLKIERKEVIFVYLWEFRSEMSVIRVFLSKTNQHGWQIPKQLKGWFLFLNKNSLLKVSY